MFAAPGQNVEPVAGVGALALRLATDERGRARAERQSAAGIPITRFGEDSLGVWFFARPGTIMRVFVIQGSVIGVVGTILGVVGGILLALNIGAVVPFLERLFGFSLFPSDIYYITELPSDLRSADVFKFALMSLSMSLLSTIYPSWRAARTHPAEALSYE